MLTNCRAWIAKACDEAFLAHAWATQLPVQILAVLATIQMTTLKTAVENRLCDQVSNVVLDACFAGDPKSKFANETAATDNRVMVAGDIAIRTKFDYYKVVREVVAKISFDSYVDVLSSVGSKGLNDKTCDVLARIDKQSPEIAGDVHVGNEDLDGAGV